MTNNRAFTLIELLVVIAIVSVLASILFPAFASARAKAQQITCASNEKQLGLAILHYVQDYDECFPIATSYDGNGPTGWAGRIYPYVKNVQVYACPDDASQATGLSGTDKLSYAFNLDLRGIGSTAAHTYWPVGPNPSGGMLAKLNSPSNTVLLCEVTGIGVGGVPNNDGTDVTDGSYEGGDLWSLFVDGGDSNGPGWIPTGQWQYNTGDMGNPARPESDGYYNNGVGIHVGGSNFLFADGHVKWLLPHTVSTGGPANALDCPQDACPASGWTGNAASTDQSLFAATFSPT